MDEGGAKFKQVVEKGKEKKGKVHMTMASVGKAVFIQNKLKKTIKNKKPVVEKEAQRGDVSTVFLKAEVIDELHKRRKLEIGMMDKDLSHLNTAETKIVRMTDSMVKKVYDESGNMQKKINFIHSRLNKIEYDMNKTNEKMDQILDLLKSNRDTGFFSKVMKK